MQYALKRLLIGCCCTAVVFAVAYPIFYVFWSATLTGESSPTGYDVPTASNPSCGYLAPDSAHSPRENSHANPNEPPRYLVRRFDSSIEYRDPDFPQFEHDVTPNCIAFSRSGKYVAAGGLFGHVEVWETDSGRQVCAFRAYSSALARCINTIAWSPDDQYLVTTVGSQFAPSFQKVNVWNVSDAIEGDPWRSHNSKRAYDRVVNGLSDMHSVTAANFSPDGDLLVTACAYDARIWRVESRDVLRVFAVNTSVPNQEAISDVTFSPDGRYILTGGYDGIARLWECASGKEIRSFVGHARAISAVAFSADGSFVMTGSFDETARVWQTDSGEQIQCLECKNGPIGAIALSADERYVLTGSRTADLWDLQKGSVVRRLGGQARAGHCAVALSPTGQHALTVDQYRVCMWVLSD